MEAYKYNSAGYYAGTINVQKDPMGNDYLLPPNATLNKPNFIAGKCAKWVGSHWVQEIIDYEEIQSELMAQKMARIVYSYSEILKACDALNLRIKLNTIVDSNRDFKDYLIGEGGKVDLANPVTVQALAGEDSFTENEIMTIKLKIG